MYEAKLFLGMEVTPRVDAFLQNTDRQALQFFVNQGEAYLHDLEYQGVRYLGKYAGRQIDLGALEQLEVNIKTLLSKVLTEDLLADTPLYLLSLVEVT